MTHTDVWTCVCVYMCVDVCVPLNKLKFKGQSFQKIEWKQTDGQTDATDALPSRLMRSVK